MNGGMVAKITEVPLGRIFAEKPLMVMIMRVEDRCAATLFSYSFLFFSKY